ncbi:MAG: hypothetical protein M5R36_18495 [Deltaproteobacteria bacterium]|nr:hypothetical protein [Deltaproteobacteria bacterium]
MNDEAVAKMPKDVSMDDPIATSNAVSMDAREFYTWVRGLQGPLRKLAATESGRRFLVNLRVEWELLYSDAVAKGLSKTDEFARRTYIDEVSALGKATVEQITKDNIKATRAEAQAYYDDNKTQFGGRLFDDVVEEARERATRAKVARVRKELAQALRRDRYIVSYHRENIDKLDPSGFTKGEMGVFMYPLVPDDAPDAELDSLDLSLPANPPAG